MSDRHVLVVDDDPIMLRTVERELRAAGWDCSTSAGLVDPRVAPTDVYLLDWDPHGAKMIARCQLAGIPFVVFTADASSVPAGVAVVSKPWARGELDAALREVCKNG